MSSYPIIFGGGLDPDASRYFQRAGVTDSTAKTQLNNFIKGVKRLGLWDSMVCWPLRSSQNASTTLTAYSLGGLGTFDGTLTNMSSSNWQANGISMAGGSEYIAWTKGGALNNTFSEFTNVCIVNASTGSFDGMGHADGGHKGSFGLLIDPTSVQARLMTSAQSGEYVADRSGFTSARGHIRSFRLNTFANHVIASGGLLEQTSPISVSGTVTHNINTFFIGRNSVYGATLNGLYQFYAFLSKGVSFSGAQSFYSLYKSTLGTGLALP